MRTQKEKALERSCQLDLFLVVVNRPEPVAPACKHPPERLYSWTAYDGVVCVSCCECGASLAGSLPA
jgi:hypothetical protein